VVATSPLTVLDSTIDCGGGGGGGGRTGGAAGGAAGGVAGGVALRSIASVYAKNLFTTNCAMVLERPSPTQLHVRIIVPTLYKGWYYIYDRIQGGY
jgi:hypothetical protein